MNVIFLKLNGKFEEITPKIFKALGITNYMEGDSLNALGGIYGVFSIFGVKIKIEENSYDYEDDYQYSIFVDKDVLSKVTTTEESIQSIARVITDLLYRNLQTEVATEVENGLVIYNPISP